MISRIVFVVLSTLLYISGCKADEYEELFYYPAPQGNRVVDAKWNEAYATARSLVDGLTLIEKVNITTGTTVGRCSGNTGAIESLNITNGICMSDGPAGVNADLATLFPNGMSIATTFNKALASKRAQAMGKEFFAKGIQYALSPCFGPIGIKAAGGRGWEGFGPDPYVEGVFAGLTVAGLQSSGVGAVGKHLIANEQEHFRLDKTFYETLGFTTDNTESISSDLDDRSLHEMYLWPFAEAVHNGLASVMCSYNRVNGTYACENSYLLNNILKTELEFPGFVVSDWYAQKHGVNSALAGLDMIMPGTELWGPSLTEMIVNGTVPVSRLDDMATRILASYLYVGGDKVPETNYYASSEEKFGYQYFDNESALITMNEYVDVRTELSYEASLENAIEAIVLLKNVNESLPLTKANGINRIALLGSLAGTDPAGINCDSCFNGSTPNGYGSGHGRASFFVSPEMGIGSRAFEEKVAMEVVREDWDMETVQDGAIYQDAAIVFVGAASGEDLFSIDENYGDRNNLTLWNNGDNLISNVTFVNPNTIVVVAAPGPINLESFIDNENVTAILYHNYLGDQTGTALAKILFGDENPSGRLPYTIAKDDSDYIPVVYVADPPNDPRDVFNHTIYLDYRYFDEYNIEPRFEFGFGLSYSDFTTTNATIKTIMEPSYELPMAAKYLDTYNYTATDLSESSYLFPEDFHEYSSYLYCYLDESVNTSSTYEYYPNGYLDQKDRTFDAPTLAAGGLGGNPALWDVTYQVTVDVKNVGKYAGKYVPQLYVAYPQSTEFPSPPLQLRGFDKVGLEAGNSTTVTFDITRKDLSVWDTVSQSWIVQRGTYGIYVGSSSRDNAKIGEVTLV
ncbi:glycoside hydrolase family 3 protein [[Candida] arabinofermentans NRRL YB-2248]|uniref:beta-glucosidase n=1 Tax=[Candida] arabinofermentans NRRL YB-2248 TaxID=983967 RepID=A0A1E4SWL3_9ASCO|nr:glycoside hydrolase family 3 protein [[Candida] arabinofermentans NRRL YB-2248]